MKPWLPALVWIILLLVAVLIGPSAAAHDPRIAVAEPLSPPQAGLILGADGLGRDLWSRLLIGSRVTLAATSLSLVITVALGTSMGLLASSFGGLLDRAILWISNVFLAVPGLLLGMLLVASLGPGFTAIILSVGIGGAPSFTRIARSVGMQIRGAEFVEASEALGAGRFWISFHHLLPNALAQLIPLSATHFAWALVGITTLTFLGLAGDPSLPEWGAILNASRSHLVSAPRLAIWPVVAISLTILAVHSLAHELAGRFRQ
jgi:peptide/nickel transport system permease protein